MANRFILNEVSYFGPGARKELPGVVKRLGFKKALVVTDKGLMQFGVAKMVLDVMDEAGTNKKLTDLGITEKDIDALADQAIRDVCTPGNPRKVTRDDIVSLYKQIL